MTAPDGRPARWPGDRCPDCTVGDHETCTFRDRDGCGCAHPTCCPHLTQEDSDAREDPL